VTTEAARQEAYHRRLFSGLADWEVARARLVDLTGDATAEGLLGLDQMGHFGPHGCELVGQALAAAARPGDARLRIVELGSGFGGTLRHVLGGLARRGVAVGLAIGVELVLAHCRLFRTINEALGEPLARPVCADAGALPFPDVAFDAVFAVGSAPHFAAMGAVLAESRRVLRSGGRLVFTEEVSLLRDGATPSARFLELHPEGVFRAVPVGQRRRQLRAAGFADVLIEDRAGWALDLLRDRVRAARVLRGSVEGILGVAQTERIVATLEAAREEIASGTLLPALVTARRP
jgi:SAM-dependent methyltransferase